MHDFDPGYGREPYAGLVRSYPGVETYPAKDFRTEWGPVFHRGRLDGTARVLVIGQDPASHEAVVRRILVGAAGRRFQGFLAKLGIDRSYVMVNTYLYSVYGQHGGVAHSHDPVIAAYRHAWLDALTTDNQIEAVIVLGSLADLAWHAWRTTPAGAGYAGAYRHLLHPTYPDSAAATGADPVKAMAKLLGDWNEGLDALQGVISHPDSPRPLVHYGSELTPADLATIPEADLPPGLPAWMRSDRAWAARQGATPADKRATIVVTVPPDQRPS